MDTLFACRVAGLPAGAEPQGRVGTLPQRRPCPKVWHHRQKPRRRLLEENSRDRDVSHRQVLGPAGSSGFSGNVGTRSAGSLSRGREPRARPSLQEPIPGLHLMEGAWHRALPGSPRKRTGRWAACFKLRKLRHTSGVVCSGPHSWKVPRLDVDPGP